MTFAFSLQFLTYFVYRPPSLLSLLCHLLFPFTLPSLPLNFPAINRVFFYHSRVVYKSRQSALMAIRKFDLTLLHQRRIRVKFVGQSASKFYYIHFQ